MEPIKTLMTERSDTPTDQTVLKTPEGKPDVEIVAMSAWKQAFVRATRTFIQTFAVTFATIMTGAPQAATVEALKYFDLPVPSHKAIVAIMAMVVIPLSTSVASFVQNISELKSKMDTSNPGLRA